jgi:dienelactone hydrolase
MLFEGLLVPVPGTRGDSNVTRTMLMLLTLIPVAAVPAFAAVRTETVEYRHGDAVLEGFVSWDDAVEGRRPGVVIVHQWRGPSDHEKKVAERLAGMGYVAFVADVYGKGVRPADSKEARAEASKYRAGDRALLRGRVAAGVEALRARSQADPRKVAAIGYCFGGGAVLELARDGADVRGVVSFHGNLTTERPASAETLKAKVLVLHGGDDPGVPDPHVKAFMDEMRAAKADWQFVAYGGAVHSFTIVSAGGDPSTGSAYDASADARSWAAMRAFLTELFQ